MLDTASWAGSPGDSANNAYYAELPTVRYYTIKEWKQLREDEVVDDRTVLLYRFHGWGTPNATAETMALADHKQEFYRYVVEEGQVDFDRSQWGQPYYNEIVNDMAAITQQMITHDNWDMESLNLIQIENMLKYFHYDMDTVADVYQHVDEIDDDGNMAKLRGRDISSESEFEQAMRRELHLRKLQLPPFLSDESKYDSDTTDDASDDGSSSTSGIASVARRLFP
jgi:hypothetical protein